MAESFSDPGQRERLLLIDGHALVFRGFYALQNERPLTNARGELTTGAYAFTSMLLKAIDQLKPHYVAAAFDMTRPTLRLNEYAAYKGTRSAAPEGLHSQVNLSRRVLQAMSIPMLDVPGYEADDVIGTLSRSAEAQGVDVIVLTGDNDLLQLVDDHIKVLTSRRGISDTILYDEAEVHTKFGISPEQVPDYKALRGDSSDNIPGVPGIGDKTAQKLIQAYGSIENLLERVESLPPKQRDLIKAHETEIRLARRLTTIVCDLPVTFDAESMRLGDVRKPEVIDVFHDLAFRTLIDRLPKGAAAAGSSAEDQQMGLFGENEADSPARQVAQATGEAVITTLEQLDALVATLREAGAFAFNVQATGTMPMRSEIVGLGLATDSEAAYVPVGHTEGEQLSLSQAVDHLRDLFGDATVGKRAHNAKFHMVLLARAGVPVKGLIFDTMIAAYLLESGQRALALRDLAWAKLQTEVPSVASMLGTGKKALTMAQLPIDQCSAYACQEAALVEQLWPLLDGELAQAGQTTLYREVELPLVPVLAEMERVGIQVDEAYLADLDQDLTTRLAALEAEIYQLAGRPFNVGSTQQLSQILFEELHLKSGSRRGKTKSGQQSTSVDVLEELRDQHRIVGLILEHRQLQKLKSTYVDALRALVDPATHRVHTTFNQTVAATGRLSSTDPNLQNVPVRTEEGRRVRRVFVARPGSLLLSADYSQIELRILAHITDDPTLLEAFAEGEDPHAATAAEVLGLPIEQVTSEHRRVAKMVNYGVLYGMSDFGLAERLGLPPAEATSFIKRYFERFDTVPAYQDRVIKDVERLGYAETIEGRRRYFPEIRSPIHAVRQAAIRAAVNAPIQGSASDIVKIAMISVQKYLKDNAADVDMLLQVHDELLLEGPETELRRIAPWIKQIMESARSLHARLHVDFKMGPNWEELKPITIEPLGEVDAASLGADGSLHAQPAPAAVG